MGQVSNQAQREYVGHDMDIPTRVHIPGTKRYVSIRGTKVGTLERLTLLWQAKEANRPSESSQVLKDMCIEPSFAIREACLFVLNSFWKIKFIYPIMWRWWAYVRQYTEHQMTPIIAEGKKKLPLMAHWENMAYSADMRTDLMKMTMKEAEQYRAELLLVQSQHSSKNSPAMEDSVTE